MARVAKSRTGSAKTKATKAAPRVTASKRAVVNPQTLTEDDADYLFYCQHKHEKTHSLDKVMRDAGFKLES